MSATDDDIKPLSTFISRDMQLDVRNAYNTKLCQMKTHIFDKVLYLKRDLEVYSGGSSSEGTETSASDTDAMIAVPDVMILMTDTVPDVNLNFCRADTSESNPGYIRLVPMGLIAMHEGQFGNFNDMIESTPGGRYISSERFVLVNAPQIKPGIGPSSVKDFFRHGPCLTTDFQSMYGFRTEKSGIPLGVDIALALECDQWPEEAKEWITRERQHNWPELHLIEKISQNKCFAVPVGDPTSAQFSREWRVSFLLGERDLIWNFNDTQIQCYVILKMLRQSYIDTIVPDQISSYHIKTLIFWLTEEHGLSPWTEDNLFLCIQNCVSYLITCIQKRELQHYFYRKNNLFRNKLRDKTERDLVVKTLRSIKGDIKYVLDEGLPESCQIFQEWKQCGGDTRVLIEKCNCIRELLDRFELNKRVNGIIRCSSTIMRLCNNIAASIISLDVLLRLVDSLGEDMPSHFDKDFVEQVRVFLVIRLGIVGFCCCNLAEGQSDDAVIQRSQITLEIGQKFDSFTGSLYLATFHLACRKYGLCRKLAAKGLARRQSLVYTGNCSENPLILTRDGEVEQAPYISLTGEADEQLNTTFDVMFSKNDMPFVPEPLKYECAMFSNYGDGSFLIHPCVYANMLLFFSYFLENDFKSAEESLFRLEKVVWDIGYTPLRYQAFNILGFCYSMDGQFNKALSCYVSSLRDTYERPVVKNAASYHIAILFIRAMNS